VTAFPRACWRVPTPGPGRGTTLPFPAKRRHRSVVSISSTLERPPRREAPPSTLRGFAAVFVAGGVAGVVVGGIGSRIAMRIAAVTARDVAQGLTTDAGATIGRITFEGTAFLVVAVGIGTALVGTAFYLATLPWLPRRRRLRALAFGGLELVVFGTVLLDPGNPDFTILGRPLLNVLVLGSLFVLHGVALVIPDSPKYPFRTLEVPTEWTLVRFHHGSRGRNGNCSTFVALIIRPFRNATPAASSRPPQMLYQETK